MDEIEAEFVKYQELLDAYYDKKERIYQTSRGIAIESKRIICLLHRPRQLNSGCFKEAERRLQTVRDTGLQSLAKELNGEELSMFQSSYSFGLQEYIEALLLFYFLSRKSIPLLEDVRRLLVYTDNQGENYLFLHVSIEDYVGAELTQTWIEPLYVV
uniref:Translin-associated factor X-interacting protein 1 N-terminal domain-containing protein n=1 Tax=Trichuris muris TaxID=70415 RepID=A0A5S6QTL1_TRIMR